MKTQEQIKDEIIRLYQKQRTYDSYEIEIQIKALEWTLEEQKHENNKR